MAHSPFLQMPFVVSGGAGPLIAAADAKPIFPAGVESGAYGHWDFGGSPESLIDLVSGNALTLAGSAPTYNADSIKIADGGTHGLITSLDDAAACTFCAVIQLYTAGSNLNQILFGTSTNVSGDGGSMGYLQGGSANVSPIFQSRPSTNLNAAALSTTLVGAGQWVFVAFSRSDAAPRLIYTAGVGATTEGSAAAKTVSSRKVAIGAGYYPTSAFQYGAKFAEAVLFTGAKTEVELAAIAARAKVRMQRKGIAVYGV